MLPILRTCPETGLVNADARKRLQQHIAHGEPDVEHEGVGHPEGVRLTEDHKLQRPG